MKTQSIDTHPKIERIIIEGHRKMTAAQKFTYTAEMFTALESLAAADTRSRHPNDTERQIRLRVASRRIAPELMKKAFGWDVEKEGY